VTYGPSGEKGEADAKQAYHTHPEIPKSTDTRANSHVERGLVGNGLI